MNIKDFFKQNDPSGKFKNEKYIKNNFPDYYDIVIDYSKLNNIEELTFKQKVYHFVYDIKNIICCKVCNKAVRFKNFTIGYHEYCSNKCVGKSEEIKNTKKENSIKKWGVDCPQKTEEIKNKIIKTNIEKYGFNSPLQNKDILQKSKDTLFKNYKVEHPSKSKEIQDKRIKNFDVDKWKENFSITMLDKYGVENALQNEDIKNKMFETNISKYGFKNPIKNEIVKEKTMNTVKNKYGVDCVLKDEEIKKKALETMIEKYGVDNVFKNDKIKEKIKEIKKPYFKQMILNTYQAKDVYINDYDKKIIVKYCEHCKKDFEIEHTLISNRKKHQTTICTNCNPNNSSKSGLEIQILNFIKENYSGQVIHNSRSIIGPLELDIYLPEFKTAIEFNGLWWHNEINKPDDYHKMKSDICFSKGIRLIHIWEDDWKLKQDIIKSIILSSIKDKVKLEKYDIKLIDDYSLFLKENGINGYLKAEFNMGLFKEEELISLLSYDIVENKIIIRNFCDKINIFHNSFEIIILKLKELKKTIEIELDRSYVDIRKFLKHGFRIIGKTEPKFYYIINETRINSNLLKENDNIGIYDSGTLKLNYHHNIMPS
jgi:hypothetical protein